jgi:spore maturation protein CgeB
LARELVLRATQLHPEFLLVFKGRFITPGVITRLRSLGIRCYNFFPDVSFRAHGAHLPKTLPEYNWIFTTKAFGIADMREQLGVTNASVMMHAFDPDLHRPMTLSGEDHEQYDCDLSFIGTWSPKKEAVLADLIRRRPNMKVRIWGEQWSNAASRSGDFRRAIGGRGVAGVEFVKAVCASKINLAIMSEQRAGASSGDRVSSRTFQLPACGGFVIHERSTEVTALFREGEEIVCYGDVDELVAAVDQYLADPAARGRIAARAHELVRRRDSWDCRVRDILEHHERSMVNGAEIRA